MNNTFAKGAKVLAMISIQTLEIFVLVAESKSFTDTANRLGVIPSSISRQMNSLEDALGTKLLNRTTRSIQLTEAGETLATRMPELLASLDETFSLVQDLNSKPKGLLKITAPVVFGELYFSELIASFRARFPDIQIELHLSENFVDIIEQGFDLALRIGTLRDSSLRATKLATNAKDVVISPDLLQSLPSIQSPLELDQLPCLTFRYESGRELWQFKKEHEITRVHVNGPMRVNNSKLLVDAAAKGLGIALSPHWLTAEYIKRGNVVTLFDDFDATASEFDSGIYLVYPDTRQVSGKVRAFIDFSKGYFQKPPWAS